MEQGARQEGWRRIGETVCRALSAGQKRAGEQGAWEQTAEGGRQRAEGGRQNGEVGKRRTERLAPRDERGNGEPENRRNGESLNAECGMRRGQRVPECGMRNEERMAESGDESWELSRSAQGSKGE